MPNTVSRRPYQLRSTQIAEYLRERLQAGEWAGQLPGERVLAEQAGVSRRTVRAALETLQQEGWVAERSRQGTQVARKRRRRGSSDARAGVRANAIGGGGGGGAAAGAQLRWACCCRLKWSICGIARFYGSMICAGFSTNGESRCRFITNNSRATQRLWRIFGNSQRRSGMIAGCCPTQARPCSGGAWVNG
ncbi:GntR family transcriptional regulator [Opitutaceae bacterium TAV3]|nr:GntR family transcriptional regulator [Opitutaceae bacterium TAV3]